MRVNFDGKIMHLDNSQLIVDGKPATLGMMIVQATLANYEDERNVPGDKKIERFKIAERAYEGGEGDLTAEEIVLVKYLLAKFYTPLPVARAYAMLDPPPQSKKIKKLEVVSHGGDGSTDDDALTDAS